MRVVRSTNASCQALSVYSKRKRIPSAAGYATRLFRLRRHSIAFAERVGSAEPYGIDEAHDLLGGCEGDSEGGGSHVA